MQTDLKLVEDEERFVVEYGVDGGDDHGLLGSGGVGGPRLDDGRRVDHQRDLAARGAHVGEELRRPPQQRVLAGQRQVLKPVRIENN